MIIPKGLCYFFDLVNKFLPNRLANIIKKQQIHNIPKIPHQLKQPIDILSYFANIIINETKFYYIV
jgi:hypothetical protein